MMFKSPNRHNHNNTQMCSDLSQIVFHKSFGLGLHAIPPVILFRT